MFKYLTDTIKCWCGYDTGLNRNGFYKVIPPEGLKCPKCGNIIIRGSNPDVPWKPNKSDILYR